MALARVKEERDDKMVNRAVRKLKLYPYKWNKRHIKKHSSHRGMYMKWQYIERSQERGLQASDAQIGQMMVRAALFMNSTLYTQKYNRFSSEFWQGRSETV